MALPVRRREPQHQSLQRWEPFSELEEMQERTLQLLESVWAGDGLPGIAAFTPPVDIEETDDAWVVEAEIPGAKRDDVNVEVRDNELHVSGEIVERERKGIIRRRTRRVGRFDYRVTLPGQVDASGVDARLEHGVLVVRVPKPEQARAHQVDVQSA